METTLYEVQFLDGRLFRVFCRGKCKKATETEYQDLKTELESIGYNLNIL